MPLHRTKINEIRKIQHEMLAKDEGWTSMGKSLRWTQNKNYSDFTSLNDHNI